MMKHLVVMSMVLVLAAGALFAQAPAPVTGPNTGSTVLVNTPKGLFALRDGVLAKYDIATLKPAQELQLFGPMPAPPADFTDNTARQKYFSEFQRRTAPAIMIPKDTSLLVVVSDGFARINQDTLKVEASADLTPAGGTTTAAGGGMGRGFQQAAAPGFLLNGNTLYVMTGKEMLSINITDGKILARTALPQDLQPLQMNFPGGGGPGGGRGGRGNRGGGGGAPGGAGAPGGTTPNTPPAE